MYWWGDHRLQCALLLTAYKMPTHLDQVLHSNMKSLAVPTEHPSHRLFARLLTVLLLLLLLSCHTNAAIHRSLA
jgi:hypothetical protein